MLVIKPPAKLHIRQHSPDYGSIIEKLAFVSMFSKMTNGLVMHSSNVYSLYL